MLGRANNLVSYWLYVIPMSYLTNLTTNSYNSWLYMWAIKLMYDFFLISYSLTSFIRIRVLSAESRLQTNNSFFFSPPTHHKYDMPLCIVHSCHHIIIALILKFNGTPLVWLRGFSQDESKILRYYIGAISTTLIDWQPDPIPSPSIKKHPQLEAHSRKLHSTKTWPALSIPSMRPTWVAQRPIRSWHVMWTCQTKDLVLLQHPLCLVF
jgi:hypothetical protein